VTNANVKCVCNFSPTVHTSFCCVAFTFRTLWRGGEHFGQMSTWLHVCFKIRSVIHEEAITLCPT
jgi:hypothetical protein